jgi:hypothetical protein
MSPLTALNTYSVRAYATNALGTSYGAVLTVTIPSTVGTARSLFTGGTTVCTQPTPITLYTSGSGPLSIGTAFFSDPGLSTPYTCLGPNPCIVSESSVVGVYWIIAVGGNVITGSGTCD